MVKMIRPRLIKERHNTRCDFLYRFELTGGCLVTNVKCQTRAIDLNDLKIKASSIIKQFENRMMVSLKGNFIKQENSKS